MKEFNKIELRELIRKVRAKVLTKIGCPVEPQEILDLASGLQSALEILETHDLCHDLHGKVGVCEFAKGCAKEQIKHFGQAPHADALLEIRKIVDKCLNN